VTVQDDIKKLPKVPLQKGDTVVHIEGWWFRGTVQAFFVLKEEQVIRGKRIKAGTTMALVKWDDERFKKIATPEFLKKRKHKYFGGASPEQLIVSRGTGIAKFFGKWVSVNQLRKI
jgi:hypothetical protein